MRHGFLCSFYRSKLIESPEATLDLWLKGMSDGEYYGDQGQLDTAIPCFGGAFEAAEILFNQPAISSMVAASHLTTASIMLARTLHRDGQLEFCRIILQSARNRIHGRLADPAREGSFSSFAMTSLVLLDRCYLELFEVASVAARASRSSRTGAVLVSGEKNCVH